VEAALAHAALRMIDPKSDNGYGPFGSTWQTARPRTERQPPR
jgi:hypothetical protein